MNSNYCFENIVQLIEQRKTFGKIYQFFGLPLTGKSTFLARFIFALIRNHIVNEVKNTYRFYICRTPGENFWHSIFPRWFEKFTTESKCLHSQSYCNFSLNFVEVNSSDDLLRSLNSIQNTEQLNPLDENIHIIIIVDSLNFIWQELLMLKKSRHGIHWYYLNLIQQLRNLTNRSYCTQHWRRTFTVFFTNGCHGQIQDDSLLKLPLHPFTYSPALGIDSLEKEVDYNFYIEYVYMKTAIFEKNTVVRFQRITVIKTGKNTSFLLLPSDAVV